MSIKNQHTSDKQLDIKKVLQTGRKYWYWFAVSLLFFVALAIVANKVLRPKYMVYSSIYIKEDMGLEGQKAMEFIQSFSLFDRKMNYQNEMLILKSSPLIRETIEKLNLETACYYQDIFMDYEMYNNSPFEVIIDTLHNQVIDTDFEIVFNNDGTFKIAAQNRKYSIVNYSSDKRTLSSKELDFEGSYFQSEVVEGDDFKFRIFLNENVHLADIVGKSYSFKFFDKEDVVKWYEENLKVNPVNPDVSVVELTLKTAAPNKDLDFIHTLTNLYLNRNLERKNHLARNTISYINSQLSEIADSLSFAENKLENFRASNQVMDINTKAARVLEKLKQLELGKETAKRAFNYYSYLDEYFKEGNNFNDVVVPSSMGVQNLTLSELIRDLLILSNQRDDLIGNKQQKSPFLKKLEVQIENLTNSIKENIRFSLESLQREMNDYQTQISQLEKEVEDLPKTERQLVGIERKFQINDAIYTFLLQKRAEAQISKASNLPEHEIVEPARIRDKVFPNMKINLVMAFFLGFVLPVLLITISETINDKIRNEEMLTEKFANTSFLGTVIKKTDNEGNLVVNESPTSPIAETYRTIRTNLFYFMRGEEHKTILVTSSVAGEGKSFISYNLATSFATLGKKTILVGFDLRKHNQFQDFKPQKSIGLSSYYIKDASLNDIIQDSGIPNLDIITPGIIPPNPLELIGNEMTKELFDDIKKEYDYIVIDTPPLGVLSDAYILMKHSDVNLFVVRENFTKEHILKSVLSEIKDKDFSNVGLVLNASRMEGKKYKYDYYNKFNNSKKA